MNQEIRVVRKEKKIAFKAGDILINTKSESKVVVIVTKTYYDLSFDGVIISTNERHPSDKNKVGAKISVNSDDVCNYEMFYGTIYVE